MQSDSWESHLYFELSYAYFAIKARDYVFLGGGPHDEQWEKDPRETTVLISATSDSKE